MSALVDLLSKREFLYREYFLNRGLVSTLPNYLTASPTNKLIDEVRKSYSFIDPTLLIPEVSRDNFILKTDFAKLNALRSINDLFGDTLNINTLNFIANHFIRSNHYNEAVFNLDL